MQATRDTSVDETNGHGRSTSQFRQPVLDLVSPCGERFHDAAKLACTRIVGRFGLTGQAANELPEEVR